MDVKVDSSLLLVGRVINPSTRNYAKTTDTQEVEVVLKDVDLGTETTITKPVADCVFDSLQTDALLSSDRKGYNFACTVSGFPNIGSYNLDLNITFTSGVKVSRRFNVTVYD